MMIDNQDAAGSSIAKDLAKANQGVTHSKMGLDMIKTEDAKDAAAGTAASTVEKEDMTGRDDDPDGLLENDEDEEERAVEELRARRDQLQGMVDENDFDIDELRMLGEDGNQDPAAFERIFDDDLAAEESKAMQMRHQKTA